MADPVVHMTAGVLDSGTGNITTLGQTLLDGANATHGATTGAAVITDAAGTFQQYLRGLVKLIAAGINVTITNANTDGQKNSLGSAPVVVASDQSDLPIKPGSSEKAASGVTIATSGVGYLGWLSSIAELLSNSLAVTPADQYSQYETVAVSQSAQAMGVTGATGDYLAGVLVFPGTAGCGVVTVLDNATTIGTFAGGGTTALPSLVPFMIPIGLVSVSGAWKITTGANVTAVGIGKFT